MKFTFCQNGSCCSTGNSLPAQKNRCTIKSYIDFGECSNFNFIPELTLQGNVTFVNEYPTYFEYMDGWLGEYIKLILPNGYHFECTMDGWIGGPPHQNHPLSRDLTCFSGRFHRFWVLEFYSQSFTKNEFEL